ncbi:MAG: orotidine 5'-phosphate decarboxylase [Candidatus Heimdallarchaeota archaeon]|nr:orotidine 5'-phosphate decarboxylase [Candidatus Heimdallarchaeota archaeon]MCK4955193.1 orotidine 5'-phosphate decarboxylase [Candidatus Heimdallarchaeota archaeon]
MKLISPPYLQIALDLIDKDELKRILSEIPSVNKILIEAGTPLIKKFGISILKEILQIHPDSYIIADMKTLDVGRLEVQIAAEEKTKAVTISALSSNETIESSLEEAKKRNVDIILDLMNVDDPLELLKQLSRVPEIVLFHRGIDQEGQFEHSWEKIKMVKQYSHDLLVAVAGGLNLQTSLQALKNGADIIVIGRAITAAANIDIAVQDFLDLLK